MINLFIATSILMWCVWFHEIGHLLYFKLVLKKNVELKFTFKKGFEIYFNENKYNTLMIYLLGVAFGFLPIFIGFTLLPHLWNVILLVMYLAGSLFDLKQIMRLLI